MELAVAVPAVAKLRASKVKPRTLKLYAQAVEDFREWAKLHRRTLRSHRDVDESMCLYLNDLCEDGVNISYGSYTIYGWILLASSEHLDSRQQLPFAKQSLRGWKSRFPGHVRSGVDLVIWDLIALQCFQNGCPLAAVAILIQGDTYLRAGELFSLTKRHLIPPRAARSRGIWGVIVGLLEDGLPCKNKDFDDCVLFNSGPRHDVNQMVAMLYKRRISDTTSLLNPLTHSGYNDAIKAAAQALGLSSLQLSAHNLRHSGASHDCFHAVRTPDEIQARGRWKCAESVRRYRRPGRMLLSQKNVPAKIWKLARTARSEVMQALVNSFPF